MPHLLRARWSRKNKPAKGKKVGLYDKAKDIQPAPRSAHININLPMEYAIALQEKYPDKTLYKAAQLHIMATIQPVREL